MLLRAISERDPGTAFGKIPANIRILHVQQEVEGDDRTPLQTVLGADIELSWLLAEAKRLEEKEKANTTTEEDDAAEDEEGCYDIQDIYDRLREIDSHKAEPRYNYVL